MPDKHTSEFHCHLNGSFSLSFLEQTAVKNGCLPIWEDFVHVQRTYLERTTSQPEAGFSSDLIAMVWEQFRLIHQIIRDLEDIVQGTLDVVKNSKSKYIEIRTTPKSMAGSSRNDYIKAFEQGLVLANERNADKRSVGLLSLDRTLHTIEDAQLLIEYIKASPVKVLAGLDISGNPLATRTLSGDDLRSVLDLVLENGLSIAIHMGEADTEQEKRDTDIILSTLEDWKLRQPAQDFNPLHGRVRLGHCIFLTDMQKTRIRQLEAPVEVCPSCHNKLNWHLDANPHPATTIYSDISDPLVAGTDDSQIFNTSIKTEFNLMLSFFGNANSLSKKEVKEHQSRFRFAQ
jgi:adenosine deaminase